jgi:hypothetical protein
VRIDYDAELDVLRVALEPWPEDAVAIGDHDAVVMVASMRRPASSSLDVASLPVAVATSSPASPSNEPPGFHPHSR